MQPNQYDTLSQADIDLRKRGYKLNFEVDENGLYFSKDDKHYSPGDVVIVEHHRFEGESDPEDMSVIYAIELNDGKKGVLIDAYGTYASEHTSGFIRKIEHIKQQGLHD